MENQTNLSCQQCKMLIFHLWEKGNSIYAVCASCGKVFDTTKKTPNDAPQKSVDPDKPRLKNLNPKDIKKGRVFWKNSYYQGELYQDCPYGWLFDFLGYSTRDDLKKMVYAAIFIKQGMLCKELRIRKGHTLVDIAMAFKCGQSTIKKYEDNGPSKKYFKWICKGEVILKLHDKTFLYPQGGLDFLHDVSKDKLS